MQYRTQRVFRRITESAEQREREWQKSVTQRALCVSFHLLLFANQKKKEIKFRIKTWHRLGPNNNEPLIAFLLCVWPAPLTSSLHIAAHTLYTRIPHTQYGEYIGIYIGVCCRRRCTAVEITQYRSFVQNSNCPLPPPRRDIRARRLSYSTSMHSSSLQFTRESPQLRALYSTFQ